MQRFFPTLTAQLRRRSSPVPERAARGYSLVTFLGLLIIFPLLCLSSPAPAAESQEVDNKALFESYAETLQKIHADSGVPISALQGILASVEPGLSDDDPETTTEVLEAKARDFLKILEDMKEYSGKDPDVLTIRKEARQNLERGNLAEAEKLFIAAREKNMQAAAKEDDARQRHLLAAEDSADAAAVALLQVTYSSYRNAIDYYAEAARVVEKSDPSHAHDYRLAQVRILDVLASDFWDAGALDELGRLYPKIIKGMDADKEPELWGDMNNSFGVILRDLAEQRGDKQLLFQAVEAHRQALKVYSREKSREEWTRTNVLLANALRDIGSMDADKDRLREAADCYRNALGELKMEDIPEEWVFLQSSLANVFLELGRGEGGGGDLKNAVQTFRTALSVTPQDQEPEDRAAIQTGLGLALRLLGGEENSADNLRESVQVFREVAKARTRENDPMLWAATQNNLGSSLVSLAELEKQPALLKEAIALYRAALEERTRDASENDWAATQNNLGLALHNLGAMQKSQKRLKEAEKAFLAALKVFTEQAAPPLHELVKGNLADTRELLRQMKKK